MKAIMLICKIISSLWIFFAGITAFTAFADDPKMSAPAASYFIMFIIGALPWAIIATIEHKKRKFPLSNPAQKLAEFCLGTAIFVALLATGLIWWQKGFGFWKSLAVSLNLSALSWLVCKTLSVFKSLPPEQGEPSPLTASVEEILSQKNEAGISKSEEILEIRRLPTGMDEATFKAFNLLVKGVLADDQVTQEEAETLHHFLSNNTGDEDSRTRHILFILDMVLEDNHLDNAEAEELKVLLGEFIDASFDFEKAPKPKPKRIKANPDYFPKEKKHTTEQSSHAINGEFVLGEHYQLKYKDSTGIVTSRIVKYIKTDFNKAGNEVLKCFCTTRKARRSFRKDRVISAVNCDTGEVII